MLQDSILEYLVHPMLEPQVNDHLISCYLLRFHVKDFFYRLYRILTKLPPCCTTLPWILNSYIVFLLVQQTPDTDNGYPDYFDNRHKRKMLRLAQIIPLTFFMTLVAVMQVFLFLQKAPVLYCDVMDCFLRLVFSLIYNRER